MVLAAGSIVFQERAWEALDEVFMLPKLRKDIVPMYLKKFFAACLNEIILGSLVGVSTVTESF